MFSCGRPCLRRRLSVVLDTVAAGPDEPLLFLYPRWAASALRHRRPISSLTPAAAPVKTCRVPFRTTVCPRVPSSSFRSHSSRWISSSAVAQAHNSTGGYVSLGIEDGHTKLDGEEKVQKSSLGSDGQSSSGVGPKQPVNSEIGLPPAPEAVPKQRERRRRILGSRGLLRSRPLSRRISPRDRKKLRYGRSVRARPHHTSIRRLAGNWTDIKNLLVKVQDYTRKLTRKARKHQEIMIPEVTVGLLVGVVDTTYRENIYFSSVRNGCRVHILPPSEGDGFDRKAILSGTEHARELVKDSIARANYLQVGGDPLVDLVKPPVPIFSSTLAMRRKNMRVPLIRGVWSTEPGESLDLDEVLEHRSPINSVKEFVEHIDDLTRVLRKSSRRTPGPPSVPCQQLVAQELLALFREDENRKFFSTGALNLAVEYLCEREMFSVARAVFNLAQNVATVDTYNLFLESAARRQDKKAFRFFLHTMWRAHICPNSMTWIKLLEAQILPSHKANLINYMAENGHMDDIGTIRSALQLTIEDSFYLHVESGQKVESFVNLMVKTHGANWFSPSLLAQMFSVIFRLKDFDALEDLLKICIEHDLAIDSNSLIHIVGMCRGNVFNAVHYTIRLLNRPLFTLSGDTYERLFLLAFKARRYNICRVLWRYACTEDKVTYKMRKAVLSSLSSNVSIVKRDNDIGRIWRTSAGKVIVGIENLAQHPFPADIIKALPVEFKHKPHLYLSRFQPTGPSRDIQHRLAHCIINRDIEASVKYECQFSLGVMLEAAVKMDREWANQPWPLTWLMSNAIKVPIKHREDV